jgi:hypothetical protein
MFQMFMKIYGAGPCRKRAEVEAARQCPHKRKLWWVERNHLHNEFNPGFCGFISSIDGFKRQMKSDVTKVVFGYFEYFYLGFKKDLRNTTS